MLCPDNALAQSGCCCLDRVQQDAVVIGAEVGGCMGCKRVHATYLLVWTMRRSTLCCVVVTLHVLQGEVYAGRSYQVKECFAGPPL